jgi:tRNA dimethylallyltransferase|tara:strand:+ start:48976 stop:49911 length:936 start_codon:yes stop_codon:yes gene_type:complete
LTAADEFAGLIDDTNLLVVLGPTASGKTRLSVRLATRLDGEIISADSRQVYRGLDIGSGKDLQEYGEVPYHLIDIVDPGHEFNLFEYQQAFFEAFAVVRSRQRLPLLVGGSGLYLDAVLKGYRLVKVAENPELRQQLMRLSHRQLVRRLQNSRPRLHNRTDLEDRSRLVRAIEIAEGEATAGATLPSPPPLYPILFGLRFDRDELRQRITRRLKARLEDGMIEEVQELLRSGLPSEALEFYGLEYRYVAQFIRGALNRNDMFQKLNSAIHQFAKRQETWFRKMERNGASIHWLDGRSDPFKEAMTMLGKAD